MPKEDKESVTDNSNFFDPIEVVKDGVDVGLETELLDLQYDLAGLSVSLDDINSISVKRDDDPLGIKVSYENETVTPMITFEFSDKNRNRVDEKSIVDAALEEYEKSIQKEGDGS